MGSGKGGVATKGRFVKEEMRRRERSSDGTMSGTTDWRDERRSKCASCWVRIRFSNRDLMSLTVVIVASSFLSGSVSMAPISLQSFENRYQLSSVKLKRVS